MIRITAALLLIAVPTVSHAASSCEVGYLKLIPDVTVTGQMQVVSGKPCGIAIANSAGGTKSQEITRRASNGKAEIVGFVVRYTSRPGFVGKDSFSYVRHALDATNNRPITLPVNIDVTVTSR